MKSIRNRQRNYQANGSSGRWLHYICKLFQCKVHCSVRYLRTKALPHPLNVTQFNPNTQLRPSAAHRLNNRDPNRLPSVLNSLTCFQPISPRRTSGHCPGTFIALNFSDSTRDGDDDYDDDDDDDDDDNNNRSHSDNIWTP